MKFLYALSLLWLVTNYSFCQKYDYEYPFNSYRVAKVEKNEKFGLINSNREMIVPVKYDYLDYIASENLGLVTRKEQWIIINLSEKKNIHLPKSYSTVRHFSGNLFTFSNPSGFGLVDNYGKEIVPPVYNYIGKIEDSVAITQLNSMYGLINNTGKEIIPPTYTQIKKLKSNVFLTQVNNKYGLISSFGTELVSPVYDKIEVFSTFYKVSFDGKYGLVDQDGKVLTTATFDRIGHYSKDKSIGVLNEKTGYISLIDGTFTPSKIDSDAFPVGFKDGMNQLQRFIASRINYPERALDNGTSGRVILKFVVEKDGSISDIIVLKGIGDGCEEEAIRVLKLTSGNWIPKLVDGKPVRTHFTFPIHFSLGV